MVSACDDAGRRNDRRGAVSVADYKLAEAYRSFAGQYAAAAGSQPGTTWFSGEFGFRYYLEENGGVYLTRDSNAPAVGDRVILSHRVIAYFVSDDVLKRLRLEKRLDYPSAWPVRIQDVNSLAGFYGQFHGYLPYSLSSEPVEAIDIFVVEASG